MECALYYYIYITSISALLSFWQEKEGGYKSIELYYERPALDLTSLSMMMIYKASSSYFSPPGYIFCGLCQSSLSLSRTYIYIYIY